MTLEDLEDAIGGTGTVTNVVAGTGLSGGGTTTATLDLESRSIENFIESFL